jgi:hypothetical protein
MMKCLAAVCLLLVGLLVSTNVASARWSRGECTDAANQKFGQKHASHHTIDAAVHRCMRRGPSAV